MISGRAVLFVACVACAALPAVCGCGDAVPGLGGGWDLPPSDGSRLPPPDASPADHGHGFDGGFEDAGLEDACVDGGAPDAGEDDAGLDVGADSGTLPDAAADGGVLPADAGRDGGRDAGVDAGVDAGGVSLLTGNFITRSIIAVKVDQIGLSPNPQVTHASQYFVIHNEQNGRHLSFATKICYLDLPDTKAIGGARVTETFYRKRPPSEFLAAIASEGEFLSKPEPGAAYTPSPQTVFLGYDGSRNPDLPSNPGSDGRVFDHDADGKPGLTIHIEGMPIIGTVDAYVVEKTITRESGTFDSPNQISGRIDFYSAEENVFDASNPIARGNNPAISYEGSPPAKDPFGAPMPANLNTFVEKRVDGRNGSPALIPEVLATEADYDAACKRLFGQACDPQNANRCWAICWDTVKQAKVKCTESNLFD